MKAKNKIEDKSYEDMEKRVKKGLKMCEDTDDLCNKIYNILETNIKEKNASDFYTKANFVCIRVIKKLLLDSYKELGVFFSKQLEENDIIQIRKNSYIVSIIHDSEKMLENAIKRKLKTSRKVTSEKAPCHN